MKQRLLGSPPVFYASNALTAFLLYQWTQDSAAGLLAMAAIIGTGVVMKHRDVMEDYKIWRLEWQLMSGVRPASKLPQIVGLLIAVAVPAGFMAHDTGLLASWLPDGQLLIGYAIMLAGAIASFLLLRGIVRWARRPRRRKHQIVMICVKRRFVKVPTLEAAYRALPPHCHAVMGRRS